MVLAAYQGIQQAVAAHGSLGAKTREAIALTVGAVDKCAYQRRGGRTYAGVLRAAVFPEAGPGTETASLIICRVLTAFAARRTAIYLIS